MVEVVAVWAPRPSHEKWRDDYLDLLSLQKRTAERFGHSHVVVTDADMDREFNTISLMLPQLLMPAMIAGVVARLKLPTSNHLLFVDVDCLIGREVESAFDGTFDLGLTRRDAAPVNNGAMYVHKEGTMQALHFFERALSICGQHWGADQEAISKCAEPIPKNECVEIRNGVRLAFLSMKTHNNTPRLPLKKSFAKPYVLHFKGESKGMARDYAERFILN